MALAMASAIVLLVVIMSATAQNILLIFSWLALIVEHNFNYQQKAKVLSFLLIGEISLYDKNKESRPGGVALRLH